MRKKLLSLLLTLAMVLSLCPAALAAEDDGGDVRETNFFTEQDHADVNYEDMKYEHMEYEPIQEKIDEVRALLDDEANEAKVEEGYNVLTDEFMKMVTMYRLINVRTYQDVNDEEATEELSYTVELWDKFADAMSLLMKDILNSPCSAFLDESLTEEDKEYYLNYEAMTEEEFALTKLSTDLENEYWAAAAQPVTYEYEGAEWDDDSIYAAYVNGEVDEETYTLVSRELARLQNERLGDIYMRMLEARQQLAENEGYANYAEYAYTEVYGRDYSFDEIEEFHSAVKEYIMPLYYALYDLYLEDYYGGALSNLIGDYGGDGALDMMEPYIGQMSSELLTAFTYMRDHGLYDSDYSENKSSAGFTTMFYSYGAPFFFNSPTDYGDPFDFTTAVHEFGHYNNYFWQPCGWDSSDKVIDIAEVHSQGLELMFSHWYPDIFGEEDGATLLNYQIFNMVYAIYQGALFNELELYAHTTEGVTLEQINQKYRQLCAEYGSVAEDDPRTEMYGWVEVHHVFNSPCYYISYAVSAAGALDFWLESQEGDYFDALDHYLEFTALDSEPTFQESFELVGMESPITPEYLEQLADTMWTTLDVDARLAALEQPVTFSDVTEDNWFYDYVMFMVENDMIEGYEDGTFRPNDPTTWYILLGEETEGGDQPITRAEFCLAFAQMIGLDVADEDAAVEAMVGLGIIAGYPDGSLRPEAAMTRAEFCTAVYRAAIVMEGLTADSDANTDAAA